MTTSEKVLAKATSKRTLTRIAAAAAATMVLTAGAGAQKITSVAYPGAATTANPAVTVGATAGVSNLATSLVQAETHTVNEAAPSFTNDIMTAKKNAAEVKAARQYIMSALAENKIKDYLTVAETVKDYFPSPTQAKSLSYVADATPGTNAAKFSGLVELGFMRCNDDTKGPLGGPAHDQDFCYDAEGNSSVTLEVKTVDLDGVVTSHPAKAWAIGALSDHIIKTVYNNATTQKPIVDALLGYAFDVYFLQLTRWADEYDDHAGHPLARPTTTPGGDPNEQSNRNDRTNNHGAYLVIKAINEIYTGLNSLDEAIAAIGNGNHTTLSAITGALAGINVFPAKGWNVSNCQQLPLPELVTMCENLPQPNAATCPFNTLEATIKNTMTTAANKATDATVVPPQAITLLTAGDLKNWVFAFSPGVTHWAVYDGTNYSQITRATGTSPAVLTAATSVTVNPTAPLTSGRQIRFFNTPGATLPASIVAADTVVAAVLVNAASKYVITATGLQSAETVTIAPSGGVGATISLTPASNSRFGFVEGTAAYTVTAATTGSRVSSATADPPASLSGTGSPWTFTVNTATPELYTLNVHIGNGVSGTVDLNTGVNTTYTYTGAAQGPVSTNFRVVNGGTGWSYNIVYREGTLTTNTGGPTTASRPVDVGDYVAVVTATRASDIGALTGAFEFRILPKFLTQSMFTIAGTYTYNGAAQTPEISAADGTLPMTPGTKDGATGDYWVECLGGCVDAGEAVLRFTGRGNYQGEAVRTFTIARVNLRINTTASNIKPKTYDGTTNAEVESVVFLDQVPGQTLVLGDDYTITSARFDNANAGQFNKTVTVTVALVSNGPVSKNYTITPSANATFQRLALSIAKADLDTVHLLDYAIPEDGHGHTGKARGIGNVRLKTSPAITNGSGTAANTVTVRYNGETDKPVNIGDYVVTATIPEGTNFTGTPLTLGTYRIVPPQKPEDFEVPQSPVVRAGNSIRLEVSAVSPNGGIISYRWYRGAGEDEALIANQSGASYTAAGFEEGKSETFRVVAINTKTVSAAEGGGAEVDSLSESFTVSVIEPAVSLAGAQVTVAGKYVYTGAAILPKADSVTVALDEDTLTHGTHFTFAATGNINAGSAVLTVTGVDAYNGETAGRFTIAKKQLVRSDVELAAAQAVYTGEPLPASVRGAGGKTGLGEMSLRYNNGFAVPINAGEYEITAIILEGANFLASEGTIEMGVYSIVKRTPVLADLTFELPEEGVVFKGELPEEGLVYDGKPFVINVTLPGTGYGAIRVLFNGSPEPPSELGTYMVAVDVEGGANYNPALIQLGYLSIVDEGSSVLSGGRNVPSDNGELVAVVVPISPVTTTFTAGPNPAFRASGAVNFYRSGGSVTGGKLTIYDASGNVVRRINVDGNVTTWDLKDARGRAVAVGTYLVRGTVVDAGSGRRERVAVMVGVR